MTTRWTPLDVRASIVYLIAPSPAAILPCRSSTTTPSTFRSSLRTGPSPFRNGLPAVALALLQESEGWRRERDSNPRNRFRFSGFQDHRHRPLGHPSAGPFYS